MQNSTLAKRIAAGLLTGLVSAALITGCGGGGKPSGGSGAANNPPKIEVPARAPVSTPPTMTFKFGATEAKVYELTGVDLKKIIRTNRIVMLGDDIFFHTDTKYYEDQLQQPASGALLDEVARFFAEKLFMAMPAGFDSLPDAQRQAFLLRLLHRPVRVCGMVKNEGEPGGGPFWVRQADGTCSLQIAESSQIDMQNPAQAAIARSATHFNPVDLVCGVRDFRGRKFDLMAFRDENTGFISHKSKDGRDLKAQELPGLWNGAMADWNTLFVEVPVAMFNPVKTVNDLLRPQHQEINQKK